MNKQVTFKNKQVTLYKRIKHLRDKATVAERHMIGLLDASGIKYIFQKGFIEGDNYTIVDFYLPKPNKIVIEVDGGYHKREKQQRKDYCNTAYLEKYRGFRVVRLTNEEVLAKDTISLEELTHD